MCRPAGMGSALIMAHQIDLFYVPQLADTRCLEADHKQAQRARFAACRRSCSPVSSDPGKVA
jgi:hypothetical protein